MTTYFLEADQNGTDSVQHHIDAGRVQVRFCPSHEKFEKALIEIQRIAEAGDTIVVDTVNSAVDSHRLDAKFGTDPFASLLDRKHLYLSGDKNYATVYNWTTDSMIRRLKNVVACGIHLVTVSHESAAVNALTGIKERAPQMNPALLDIFKRAPSDIVRLTVLTQPIMHADGQTVRFPIGTRMLQLRQTDEAIAKYKVIPERTDKIPTLLPIPLVGGMHRLISVLGKRPTWLHCYGEPGVGKTTFALSGVDDVPSNVTPIKLQNDEQKEASA